MKLIPILFLSSFLTLSADQINISWTHSADQYILTYGSQYLTQSITVSTNKFTIFNPTKNRTYFFSVKTLHNDIIGKQSNTTSIHIPSPTSHSPRPTPKISAVYLN